MPQVEREVAKARARRLREAAARRQTTWLNGLVGSVQQILIERDGGGHAGNFARINSLRLCRENGKGQFGNDVGGLLNVKITGVDNARLVDEPA